MNHQRCIYHFLFLITTGLALSGCMTSVVQPDLVPEHFLHDSAFPASTAYHVESRQTVFQLDEQTQQLLEKNAGNLRDPHLDGTLLSTKIIQSIHDFSYNGGANTVASRTFRNHTANCLSLTILAYAMATHLGFDAHFQMVKIPEYWERRGENSLVARHVNLLLQPPRTDAALSFTRPIEIDFFAPGSSQRYGVKAISESTVLAMFYNNKGVDALLANNTDLAYAYLRAALLEDPALGMTLSNLALLYAVKGQPYWAEQNYREALKRSPTDTASAEGLAAVLRIIGRHKEAAAIQTQIKEQRESNPYYQYVRGEKAYAARQWQQAIHSFNRAIELQPNLDGPYFGLAKTYFQLGDYGRAEGYLRRAEHYADREDAKKRYQSKLALISSL